MFQFLIKAKKNKHKFMISILITLTNILCDTEHVRFKSQLELFKLRSLITLELSDPDTNVDKMAKKELIIDNKCGLINRQGVCYFNSVIQSLFCNKNFALFYIMNNFNKAQVLSRIIQKLAYKMMTQRSVDPIPYILELQNHPRLVNNCALSGGNPLVLLEELLTGLYKEIKDMKNLKYRSGSPENFLVKEKRVTKCSRCKTDSSNVLFSVTINVPFSNTIEESLRFYNNIKETELANKYYECHNCEMFTPVDKDGVRNFTKYPDNLIIVFERVKVRNNVIYSVHQEIDFNKSITMGDSKYEVYAAICSHMLSKGFHANAIAQKNDRWIIFNDSQLEVLAPGYIDDDIFNNYAWIIFYKKDRK